MRRDRLPPLQQLAEAEERRRENREKSRQRLLRTAQATAEKAAHRPLDQPQQDIRQEPPQVSKSPSDATRVALAGARSGTAQVPFCRRGETAWLWPQPWLHGIVDGALQAAANHEVRLVLVWPGQADSLALVHALATLERYAVGDKQGLRALIYPTTRFTFSPLAHSLVEREKLLDWARHYLTVASGTEMPLHGRDNQNKDMMLMGLQSARNAAPQSESPMLSEVIPHFEWNRDKKTWGHYGEKFLSRSKRALVRSHKRELFSAEQSGRISQLGNPEVAPDALFGISHLVTPRERREAIKSRAFKGAARQPELVFCDLTRAMQMRDERPLVQLTAHFMKEIGETWKSPCGFMIVTDDPKAFFIARKALAEKVDEGRLHVQTVVTTPQGSGFAQTPLPRNWVPDQVSLKNFRLSILDQEAAEISTRFWTISEKLEPQTEGFVECRKTAAYILRLANLPGGYIDFTNWMTSQDFTETVRRDMSWTDREFSLNSLIDRGAFGAHAEDVRRASAKATKLIECYADSTPLASRLAKETSECLAKAKTRVVVLFRFSSDIAVAHAYLTRYNAFPNGRSFNELAERVLLRNHRELGQILAGEDLPSKFVFVGLPDETLRLIVSSEKIPAQSVIIVDYRRANDVLIGLRAMRSLDTYKAYRGRISSVAGEIEKRLKELPKAIDLDKLERVRVPRLSLSTAAAEHARAIETPGSWRVELEDGRRVAVGHRVYVYDPDDVASLFRHEAVENLKTGDLVFVMSDMLKDLLESCLIAAGHPVSRGESLAEVVRGYHRLVVESSQRLFEGAGGTQLARRIKARMIELSANAESVSIDRIRYWTDVENSSSSASDGLKPHSTRQKGDFIVFARALEIPENLIDHYWMMVTGHRSALQEAGRELAERYARVLFSAESAETYYHLSRETVAMLQREAVHNTSRLIRSIPPSDLREQIHVSPR